jgi:hypothetical protein
MQARTQRKSSSDVKQANLTAGTRAEGSLHVLLCVLDCFSLRLCVEDVHWKKAFAAASGIATPVTRAFCRISQK